MNDLTTHKDICRSFAELFSYPSDNLAEHAELCLNGMQEIDSKSVAPLATFTAFVESNQASRIEEAFTAAFDLQPVCHPYIGYQLCGESQQRTMFMLKLRELYQQYDFISGNELPDHLTEVMRFIGSIADQDCRQEIIQDGLLPALAKITQGIQSDGHPYMALLNALQRFLDETSVLSSERLAVDQQKECLS